MPDESERGRARGTLGVVEEPLAGGPRPALPWWRRALPPVLAIGLVGYVLARVDWLAFVAQLSRVSYPGLVGFLALFIVLLLAADALGSRHAYAVGAKPLRYLDVLLARGASYLPSVLNHHVGQAWLTYYLSRAHGVPLGTMAGATLLVYATWMGCLLGLGCVAVLASDLPKGWLVVPLAAGIAYLAVLALSPTALRNNRVLAPLFRAGIKGHLTGMAMRLPHVAVLFVGTWLPFWFFDTPIPIGAALRAVPILMVAVTLPITPQGFGTRDVLAALFFERFVATAGASHEARLATIAAATTTQGVIITLLDLALGALLMPRASRRLREVARAGGLPPPESTSESGSTPRPGS
jgi:hypothetical protein